MPCCNSFEMFRYIPLLAAASGVTQAPHQPFQFFQDAQAHPRFILNVYIFCVYVTVCVCNHFNYIYIYTLSIGCDSRFLMGCNSEMSENEGVPWISARVFTSWNDTASSLNWFIVFEGVEHMAASSTTSSCRARGEQIQRRGTPDGINSTNWDCPMDPPVNHPNVAMCLGLEVSIEMFQESLPPFLYLSITVLSYTIHRDPS